MCPVASQEAEAEKKRLEDKRLKDRARAMKRGKSLILPVLKYLKPYYHWGIWSDLILEPAELLPDAFPGDLFHSGHPPPPHPPHTHPLK